jgi:predicted MFS family arabinose efflux permease
MSPRDSRPPVLTGRLTAILFVCILVTASTMHFYAPMLDVIAREFQASSSDTGWIATAAMLGFVSGLVLLAPLGDVMDKRLLVLGQLASLLVTLTVMTLAGSLWVLILGNYIVGMMASASQHLITLTAQLAPGERRGHAMAVVLSGLLLGILAGRLLGGFITSWFGWRAAFGTAAGLVLLVLPIMVKALPKAPITAGLRYGELLGSLLILLKRHPALRHAARVQGLLGICYGGFWATVAPMLAAAHHLHSDVVGLIGIPGAAGVLVATPVGRWVDRRGPGPAVLAGASSVFLAYVAFGFAASAVAAVVVGAMLLDIGIRASLVANQAYIAGIDLSARARTNMLLMVHTFAGNGAGAFLASHAFYRAGWRGVVIVGLAAGLTAAALQVTRRDRAAAPARETPM